MRIRDKENLLNEMSKLTPGYVPADLTTLIKEASIQSMSRLFISLNMETMFDNETGQFLLKSLT